MTPADFVAEVTGVIGLIGGDVPAGHDAYVLVEARTVDGFGHTLQWIAPPFARVPDPLLRLLAEAYELRTSTALWSGGEAQRGSFLAALWRPDCEHHGEWAVTPEGRAQVQAQLERLPVPSVLVDAGHEVWAGWKLAQVLPAAELLEASRSLARRAGAVVPDTLDDLRVPLAGLVRNWGTMHPARITIEHLDRDAVFPVESLLESGQ